MPEVILPQPTTPDMFSFGLDANLNRNSYSPIQSPTVYNSIEGAVNPGSISNAGTFNVSTLQSSSTEKFIAPGDDIQAAIDAVAKAGGGNVNLAIGTYTPQTNIFMRSGVGLIGENPTLTIIDFNNGPYGLILQGQMAYSTGTISVNFNSTTVTGVNTLWTSSMIGQSILIGDFWYTIANVGGATSITLASPLLGTNISGDTYVIATTINSVNLTSFTIQNSSVSLIKGNYVNTSNIREVTAISGSKGFDFSNSANINLYLYTAISCTTNGLIFNNVPYCIFDSGAVFSSGPFSLTRVTNTSLVSMSIQAATGVGMSLTNCSDFGITAFAIIECVSHGMELVSGNSDIDIISGFVTACGGDGIKLTASTNRCSISINSIINNTGYGVNVANANDNNNTILDNALINNTAGAFNDVGTSTISKANQGVTDSAGLTYKNGTTTKNLADASATQNIAHGLGVTPKKLKLTFSTIYGAGTIGLFGFGVLAYNGTTKSVNGWQWNATSNTYLTMSGTDVVITTLSAGDGTNNQTGVVTFDSTNIIITWTKNNLPTGTINILWEVE